MVVTLQKQVSILLHEREVSKATGAVPFTSGKDSCTPNVSPIEIHEVIGFVCLLDYIDN